MEPKFIIGIVFLFFAIGMYLGMWMRDFKWREKGDHEYMNTMESGGRLYKVKLWARESKR